MEKHDIISFFHTMISNVLRGVSLKTFPNPLTPDEEKYYFQKYTEGDLEAKHILIERNLRLVAHIVRKYQNLGEEMEDLISIGTIGLIKAVISFDPEKGNRLAAYASRCVENEILMYLRARKKGGKEISLYEPIGTDRDGNEIRLYDIIETTDTDVPEKLYLKENIQKLYEKVESELSPRERLVLKMRYGLYNGEEYTQREIASLLGISRSYVSRIEKSAVENSGSGSADPAGTASGGSLQLHKQFLPFQTFSCLLNRSYTSACSLSSTKRICFGCGAFSCSSPSWLTIRTTFASTFRPSGFMISMVSPTENLFLCSIWIRPSFTSPTIPRYVYSFTYVLLS